MAAAGSTSLSDAIPTLRAFYRASPCCLYARFSQPFRDAYPYLEQVDDRVCMFLREAGRQAAITNMPFDNILAQIKSSLPRGLHRPNVDVLAYVAQLSGLLKEHLEGGGANSVIQTTRQLKSVRLPAQASARPTRSCNEKRPYITWRNRQFNRWRNDNLGAHGQRCRISSLR